MIDTNVFKKYYIFGLLTTGAWDDEILNYRTRGRVVRLLKVAYGRLKPIGHHQQVLKRKRVTYGTNAII